MTSDLDSTPRALQHTSADCCASHFQRRSSIGACSGKKILAKYTKSHILEIGIARKLASRQRENAVCKKDFKSCVLEFAENRLDECVERTLRTRRPPPTRDELITIVTSALHRVYNQEEIINAVHEFIENNPVKEELRYYL